MELYSTLLIKNYPRNSTTDVYGLGNKVLFVLFLAMFLHSQPTETHCYLKKITIVRIFVHNSTNYTTMVESFSGTLMQTYSISYL